MKSRNQELALQLVDDEINDSSSFNFRSLDEAVGSIFVELYRLAKCRVDGGEDAEALLEILTQIAAKATKAAAEFVLPEIQRAEETR